MPDPTPTAELARRYEAALAALAALREGGDEAVLLACFSSELQEISEGRVPEWIKVVPAEPFAHPIFGVTDPTPAFRELLIANFERDRLDIVLDYNHASAKSTGQDAEKTGGKAPAAGFFDRFENREDGLFGHVAFYTDDGRADLRARKYRWISPTINYLARDRRTNALIGPALHSIALTNTPAIDGLPDITAPSLEALYSSLLPSVPRKESPMKYLALLTALGLAEGATDEEAVAAFNAKLAEVKTASPELAEYSLKIQGLEEQLAAAPTAEAHSKLEAKLAAAEKRADAAPSLAKYAQMEADLLKARGEAQIHKDRIPPALHETALALYASSVDEYAKFAANTPTIPAGSLRPPTKGDDDPNGLTEAERRVCAQYSIAPEDFIAQRKARRAARG